MQPVGIRVGQRDRGIERQLALDGGGRLHNVRRTQAGADRLNRLGRADSGQRRDRRNHREEVRICDHVLLLKDAVIPLRSERIRQAEAVIEHAESGAQHGLRPGVLGAGSRGPGQADARREVMPVVDVGLRFVAQAEAQGEVRPRPPVVAHECAHIGLTRRDRRISRVDAELRRATPSRADLLGREPLRREQQRAAIPLDGRDANAAAERECPAEILRRRAVYGFPTQPNAEPPRMWAAGNGRVILELIIVPRVKGMTHLRAACVERSKNLNRRAEIIGDDRAVDAEILKPGFVDGAGSQHGGLGDLRVVLGVLHVVSAIHQIESADAAVANAGAQETIAERHRVIGIDLIVDTRAEGNPPLRRSRHTGEGIHNGKRLGIERDAVDDRAVVDRVPLHIKKERAALVDRPAQIAAVFF